MDDSGWKYFKTNNQSFIVRRRFCVDTFKLQLSDHKRLWSFDGTASELLTMSRSENPLCEFDQSKVTKNIFNLFDKSLSSLRVEGSDENYKTLKMSSSLGNRPFCLVWTLSDQGPDALFQEVTNPLLYALSEMKCRQDYLCRLLIDKDREINEHILENGKLVWAKVKTEKFDVEEFKSDYAFGMLNEPDPIVAAWEEPDVIAMFNKHVCKKKADDDAGEITQSNEVIVKQEETVPDPPPIESPKVEVAEVKVESVSEPSNSRANRSKRKKVKLNL